MVLGILKNTDCGAEFHQLAKQHEGGLRRNPGSLLHIVGHDDDCVACG